MPRLLVHVEGQTEETFVNEVLRAHLLAAGYESVAARIIGNARLRQRRGGIRHWPAVRKDVLSHLLQDAGCVATTMVDYYGLPQEGLGAWPGRARAVGLLNPQKAPHVEQALLEDLQTHSEGPISSRFVPFVIMHEFEGLLFSDCRAFAIGIGRAELAERLQEIRNSFETPEDINDGPSTCPSRRIEQIVTGYEKPLLGTLAALEIGLTRMREQCPHFNDWLIRLESLLA